MYPVELYLSVKEIEKKGIDCFGVLDLTWRSVKTKENIKRNHAVFKDWLKALIFLACIHHLLLLTTFIIHAKYFPDSDWLKAYAWCPNLEEFYVWWTDDVKSAAFLQVNAP